MKYCCILHGHVCVMEKYNILENSDNSVVELSNAILNDYKIKWYQAINSERGTSSTGLKFLCENGKA